MCVLANCFHQSHWIPDIASQFRDEQNQMPFSRAPPWDNGLRRVPGAANHNRFHPCVGAIDVPRYWIVNLRWVVHFIDLPSTLNSSTGV